MGSFAYTCAISGLPIEAGDKVRYFLLTKNPYHTGAENTCYIHDLWFPRTFPLKGSYNDYGSVEKLTAGAEQDIWLEGLEKDMVERGWGENSVHDVPTKKTMKFSELLDAVQEGRILVQREYNHYDSMDDLLDRIDAMTGKKKKVEEDNRSPEEKRDSKVPAGVPTMYRVQKIAEKLGINIYDGSWSKPSIMIDSPQAAEVRIRCHCMYGEQLEPNQKFTPGASVKQQVEVLTKLQEALGGYSTMISTSSDGCAVSVDGKRDSKHYIQPNTELLVRPKPGTHDAEIRKRDNNTPLPVGHAMIREDVWQALLKDTVEHWNGKKTIQVGIDAFYNGVNNYVKYLKTEMKSDLYKKYGPLGGRMETGENNPGAWIAAKDVIPFTVGLATHFNLMMEKDEQPEGFFKTVAEFAFITAILAQTRHQWRPSSSAGPQFGEWEKHEKLLKAYAAVAHKHAEKQKADRAEWEKY